MAAVLRPMSFVRSTTGSGPLRSAAKAWLRVTKGTAERARRPRGGGRDDEDDEGEDEDGEDVDEDDDVEDEESDAGGDEVAR